MNTNFAILKDIMRILCFLSQNCAEIKTLYLCRTGNAS